MKSPVTCISLRDMQPVSAFPAEAVLCLGNFDGVHTAHRKLIRETVRLRDDRAPRAATGAFCFRVPTSFYLSPTPIPQLSSVEDKLHAFRKEGLDYAYLAEFEEIRELTASTFAKDILHDLCHCCGIVCGFNHRYGKGGTGTPELLGELLNVPTTILPQETLLGDTVSSTRIRQLLTEGNPTDAATLLGAPYGITATIVHGKALGRTHGIPTVNQNFPPLRLIPRHGVYLTRCTVDDKQVFGLTNVGLRPTVDKNAAVNCETFLLDFSGDLYDSSMRVEFLEFLRPETKFASEEALYEQIHRDLAAARDRIFHYSNSNV